MFTAICNGESHSPAIHLEPLKVQESLSKIPSEIFFVIASTFFQAVLLTVATKAGLGCIKQ